MTIPSADAYNGRPTYMSVDTPEGKIEVSWPQGQIIYDGLEAVGYQPPMDPEPTITLDGSEITREQADAILQGMRQQ